MVDADCDIDPGAEVLFPELVNLYGCKIGKGCRIGPFVEIQRGCVLGRSVNFQHHSYLAVNTKVGDYVFVGPGAGTTNDNWPLVWGVTELVSVEIGDYASIGANAVILPGVKVGEGAMVGAGAVVTKDVPPWSVVVGNPAKVVREFGDQLDRDMYIKKRVDALRVAKSKEMVSSDELHQRS